jgi:hypothetical protein
MRGYAKVLLTLSFLVISFAAWGQEPAPSEKPDLLVRLLYKSSAVVQHDGVQRVCVAISRDQQYRMIRLDDKGQTLRIHGTLSKEQFDKLSKLLDSPKFLALSGNQHANALIRQDAESFAAEIPLADKKHADIEPESRRVRWLNPDGENPFPASVEKIVNWIEHFQPKNGKEFEYAEFPDVCPSGELQLVQPSVAENEQR